MSYLRCHGVVRFHRKPPPLVRLAAQRRVRAVSAPPKHRAVVSMAPFAARSVPRHPGEERHGRTAEEAAATMEELATLLEINAEISDTFLQVTVFFSTYKQ